MVKVQELNSTIYEMASTNNPIPLNTWIHVAGVYDQSTGTRTMYVNGALAASRTDAPITILNASTKVGIGARMTTSTQPVDFFAGKIDEVSFYGRALSGAEIAAIYNAGGGGKCKVPLAPSIVTQPKGQTVVAGASASFNVVAAGSFPL